MVTFFTHDVAESLLDPRTIVGFTGYDLQNDVHPVFGPANSPDADYKAIQPALRLASRLLTCEASLQYWSLLCWGEEEEGVFPKGSGLEEYGIGRQSLPKAKQPYSMLYRAQYHLTWLSGFITFDRGNTMKPGTLARTGAIAEKIQDHTCPQTTTWRGARALVECNEQQYQQLVHGY